MTEVSPAMADAAGMFASVCERFARMTATGAEWRAALAFVRSAGTDSVTGLATIPVRAVTFADVLADGSRVRAADSAGILVTSRDGGSVRHLGRDAWVTVRNA